MNGREGLESIAYFIHCVFTIFILGVSLLANQRATSKTHADE